MSTDSREDLVKEISNLYELALASGDSLDLQESCSSFMNKLVKIKNLNYCAIWLRDTCLLGVNSNSASRIVVTPKRYARDRLISLHHCLFELLVDKGYRLVEDPLVIDQIITAGGPKEAQHLVYGLGEIGLLHMSVSAKKANKFQTEDLHKLSGVVSRFTAILRSCLAHDKLLREAEKQRRSILALQRTSSFLDVVINAVRDPIFVKDSEHRVMLVNDAYCSVFGISKRAILGQRTYDYMPLHRANKYVAIDNKVFRTGQDVVREEVFVDDQGTEHFFSNKLSRFTDQNNKMFLVGVTRDIKNHKSLEVELRLAISLAQQANNLKSEFIANISHEVRTPMNVIVGMTDLVLAGEQNQERRGMLSMIRDSAGELLIIINDILDFSKIEAGKMILEPRKFELREVIGSAVASLSVSAYNKALELSVFIDPELPVSLIGDPVRLRQILINLVDNAIKFTAEGEVHVSVNWKVRCKQNPVIRFVVSDTGIGIAKESFSMLFDSFFQNDRAIDKNYPGTGLGLPICQALVMLMNGEIGVESVVGEGSVFTFTAVFQSVESAEDEPNWQNRFSGLRCLIADQSIPSRNSIIANEYLAHMGVEVETCYDSYLAVDQIFLAHRAKDFCLADSSLVDDMLAYLAKTKLTNKFSNIIMILPPPQLNLVGQRLQSYGISCFLTKPIKPMDLHNILDTQGLAEGSICSQGGFENPFFRGIKVLLVEDRPMNQRLVTLMLREKGWEATVAGSGQEALSVLKEYVFDVILMDIQMPGMDGFTATRKIRELELGKPYKTPIIALTAYATEADRQAGISAGMDGYLSKPINSSDLFATIESAVVKRPKPNTKSPPLDIHHHRMLANPGTLKEVISVFLIGADNDLKDLRTAISCGERQLIARLAHGLKGELGNLGFWSGYNQAKQLEAMAKIAPKSGFLQAVTELEQEISRIRQFYSRIT